MSLMVGQCNTSLMGVDNLAGGTVQHMTAAAAAREAAGAEGLLVLAAPSAGMREKQHWPGDVVSGTYTWHTVLLADGVSAAQLADRSCYCQPALPAERKQ